MIGNFDMLQRNIKTDFKPPRSGVGFTLVELMISILLAAILMLGVNAIFKVSAATVGQGMAISSDMQNLRAAQNMLENDFKGMMPSSQSPGLIINSSRIWAYLDGPQNVSTSAGTAQITYPGDATSYNGVFGAGDMPSAPSYPAAQCNDRSHRTDILAMFANGTFSRQTGQLADTTVTYGPTYKGHLQSNQAFISYGHAMRPNLSQFYSLQLPGESTYPGFNGDQSMARKWVLARNAMLLVSPSGNIVDSYGNIQEYAVNSANPFYSWGTNSGSNYSSSHANVYRVCDVAGTTASAMKTLIAATPGWAEGLYWTHAAGPQVPRTYVGLSYPFVYNSQPFTYGLNNAWFFWPSGTTAGSPIITMNSFVEQLNQSSNMLVPGCTQFIVEFAGDYVAQDGTTGITKGNYPDGNIDYRVDDSSGLKSIRWYGLPRDVDGSGQVYFNQTTGRQRGILPVKDFLLPYQPPSPPTAPNPTVPPDQLTKVFTAGQQPWYFFEKGSSLSNPSGNCPALAGQTPTSATPSNYGVAETAGGLNEDAHYTCGWSAAEVAISYTNPGTGLTQTVNLLPKLIRVTMRIDDLNGRAPGQTIEFIFPVAQ